ncbi:MAG: hypothetical protein U5M23_02890 [Marinagarivorans sp.]|nr:hypothetical protein [Marinagarivorans sp.]
MIGIVITYLLLLISLVVSLISLAALIRGSFYRPTPKYLNLVITRRTNTQSEWFTLVLQRAWYARWQPLPRFRAGQSIAITPNGSKTKRRYSLARWHKLPFSYEVTIKREPARQSVQPTLAGRAAQHPFAHYPAVGRVCSRGKRITAGIYRRWGWHYTASGDAR